LLAIPDLWVSDLLTDVQGQLFGIKRHEQAQKISLVEYATH